MYPRFEKYLTIFKRWSGDRFVWALGQINPNLHTSSKCQRKVLNPSNSRYQLADSSFFLFIASAGRQCLLRLEQSFE